MFYTPKGVIFASPKAYKNTFVIIIGSEEQACSRPCSQHQRKWSHGYITKGNFLKTVSEKRVENLQEKSEKRVPFSSIGMSKVCGLTLD